MVRVVETIDEVRREVEQARSGGQTVGLVPTMGALHDGHVRLLEVCRAEAGVSVASIFVNPTQFGPAEDYARYPRTFDRDRERCVDAGTDLIFAPSVEVMYPQGAISTYVDVPSLANRLEGVSRPTHFRGVATVVLKLFEIVAPDVAFFGEKDYQQQLVIRRMVEDLNLRVAIRTVATVREPDGLALSSRNRYLDPEQRRAAAVIPRALAHARAAVAGGEFGADRIRQILRETIESDGRAQLDYAEVADAGTLEPLSTLSQGQPAVALLAVRVGTTRLIDNARLVE